MRMRGGHGRAGSDPAGGVREVATTGPLLPFPIWPLALRSGRAFRKAAVAPAKKEPAQRLCRSLPYGVRKLGQPPPPGRRLPLRK